ncbi:YibE/F family protein [Planococcus sp. CP5-4]|uniref:YibE/F family protein n=1 Tax=unclassified Planococcus (in: firmicutes) TaxID=2662419 RepID=UPI001C25051D|nr:MULTISPECIES: YibE/F family protein [unclassified Planococcus (in: firmicutes)]MBU9674044.1 YibE/F family protein [Planococcus sp. CP5-4_YE]MBV0909915.1 YibE/F family protein [Planococcus sp. CP5-4_UN]MBW6064795.1 YibE/F family protein [Planococcus sp. CP5-4]
MKQWFKNTSVLKLIIYGVLMIGFIGSVYFINHNHGFYDQPIAKITAATVEKTQELTDIYGNEDILYTQHLEGTVQNGEYQGQAIELDNEYSLSGANDHEYRAGQDLFVFIDGSAESDAALSGTIDNVKRDQYILAITWIFIFVLLVIGKRQGFYSIVSLALNAVILSFALDIYIRTENASLLMIASISVLLFTVTSLLLVNGFNEKTYAAILATIAGVFAALLLASFAIWTSGGNGLNYEEMQFLSRPYEAVFMAGLFIGSLGAVMDVGITMSASIFTLYEKNPDISIEAMKTSGIEIGKDIMGTMANILFFVYISGSIPMLLLYLSNGATWPFAFSITLSLEIARALAGGLGIVLTIPIGIYTSIFFIKRKRAAQ